MMRVAVSNTSNQVMTKKIHGVAVSNTSDDGGGKEERRVDENFLFFILYNFEALSNADKRDHLVESRDQIKRARLEGEC